MKAKNLSFIKSLGAGSFFAICAAMIFAGCASSPSNEENRTETLPKIDISKWLYNAEDGRAPFGDGTSTGNFIAWVKEWAGLK